MFKWSNLLTNLFKKLQPTPPKEPSSNEIINQLLIEHNEIRMPLRIPKLRLNDKLLQIAKQHAEYMNNNNRLSHIGINNHSLSERAQSINYNAKYIGENIAYGYNTVEGVMSGWLKSNGHRRNITKEDYIDCGFSKVGLYWCAIFAMPLDMNIQESCPDPITIQGPSKN